MLKLAIFFALCFVTIHAEPDPNEACVGLADGELVGIGAEFSCTVYLYCEGEYGYEEDCVTQDPDMQFNYETNACDYSDVVQCGVDPVEVETDPPATLPPVTDTTISTTMDPSIQDIECPTNRPGEILFFPSSNCTEYFICANGVRMRMVCMEGFTWNQEEKTCDFPIFSRCSVRLQKILLKLH